ncbi:VaFE repeat-containing surface-anchored protein [Leucobacter sp. GX24907]
MGALVLSTSAAQAEPEAGGTAWIGAKEGYGGTGLWPVWAETPADPANPGEPDFWTYCLEHDVSARTGLEGSVGDLGDYLGSNYFADPAIQGKVLWVLKHSYPAMSLEAFGEASGVPGISRNDAIEATQYAIWRYTDLTWDASWSFETPDSQTAYWYLVNGANASGGLTPADFETTVSVTGPATAQTADSLVGPFTVATNQATVRVVADPAHTIVDAAGAPIDTNAVVDGQQLYLDLRGDTAAGSATVSAFAQGSSASGLVLSAPATGGGAPTTDNHSQTRIIVANHSTETSAAAAVEWTAEEESFPVIGTSLVDTADGDRVLAWNGGVVRDTVAYQNLVPGTEYTVSGELMDKADGAGTGITAERTFTPTEANGEIDLEFTVPEGYSGSDLVAFEWLFEGDVAGDREDAVAEHTDIDDAAQTVTVEEAPSASEPVIGTSLVDTADGDRVLAWNGGVVRDTVAYQNLVPGTEYTVSGELMDKADGSGTGITAERTFTPTEANGEIDLEFTVPEGYSGSDLVAFECLFEGDVAGDREDAVAEHTDIDDAAQTVTVEEAPSASDAQESATKDALSKTGGSLPAFGLAIAALLIVTGIALPLTARRS